MHNRGGRLAAIGAITAFFLNFDGWFLPSGLSVAELYCASIFDIDLFMREKNLFFAMNQILSVFVCCFFAGAGIRELQSVYVLTRVADRKRLLIKYFYSLFLRASAFYVGYASMTFVICCVSCRKSPDLEAWQTVGISVFALAYLGGISLGILETFSCFLKTQNALVVTYILLLALVAGSARCSVWLESSRILLYMNPVTSMSLENCPNVWALTAAIVPELCIIGLLPACFTGLCMKREPDW